ncbi:MAG: methylated-DNA--[protein]-cysteine S-methyltransferase [Treponemataceae bacterium]
MTDNVARIIEVLKAIPIGAVVSYGEVAASAGVPRGARLVARVLHSMSKRYSLPWHRVVRVDRRIALHRGGGFELQKTLLEAEGWVISDEGEIHGTDTTIHNGTVSLKTL